ncbi:MAG: ATP-binding protein [Patescibacteria group bacterium]|nr:ATP-binding protein [Patescibacteria group bacterium]
MAKKIGLKKTQLLLPSSPDSVPTARAAIISIARRCGFDDDSVFDIAVALSEACTNAIKHGSPNGEKNEITVRCSTSEGKMIIDIRDQGNGFSIESTLLPDPCNLEENHRGIFIIQNVMDKVAYKKNKKGGVLHMDKNF